MRARPRRTVAGHQLEAMLPCPFPLSATLLSNSGTLTVTTVGMVPCIASTRCIRFVRATLARRTGFD